MNTGGPAFPVQDASTWQAHGMTLRDYFAIKALQSLMQNFLSNDLDMNDPEGWMEGLAGDAYLMADEMLKAREQ